MARPVAATAAASFFIRGAPRRRRPHALAFRPSSSSTADPQADSNTWCRPADPDMAAWAAPIVQDVRLESHPYVCVCVCVCIVIPTTWLTPPPPQKKQKKVLELYHCRVDNPALYQRYAPDAVFDDPAGIIRGRHGIRVTMEALVRG